MLKREPKYRAWDKRSKKVRSVFSFSTKEDFVLFQNKEKAPLSAVEIMTRVKENLVGEDFYEHQIVEFLEGADMSTGIIAIENDRWVIDVASQCRKVLPEQVTKIRVIGNKFEDAEKISEEYIRHRRLWYLYIALSQGDEISDDICIHDFHNAVDKLEEMEREELVALIKLMAKDAGWRRREYERRLNER